MKVSRVTGALHSLASPMSHHLAQLLSHWGGQSCPSLCPSTPRHKGVHWEPSITYRAVTDGCVSAAGALRSSSLPFPLSLCLGSSLPAQQCQSPDTGGSCSCPAAISEPGCVPRLCQQDPQLPPQFFLLCHLTKCRKVLCINKWNCNSATQKHHLCHFTYLEFYRQTEKHHFAEHL